MALSREWQNRIGNWLAELERQLYLPLGKVELEGFVTSARLSPGEAAASREYVPMPAGTAWGGKWEYAWFRGRIVLPASAKGKRIVLSLSPGKEGLVFINGAAAGARDREHGEITLAREARGGEAFDILAEFYAGHGPIEENIGPVPPGRVPLPEPGPTQRTVGESSWGEWDDEAFGLLIDAEALYQTRSVLPETSLRVSEIDEALRDFTRIADFEQPREEMRKSFSEARLRLAPLLACVNGSTAPLMHVFGNSHLDLAWQWPFEETIRKSARTVSTQLALLEEYPEYRFLWCQVPVFETLREHYPEIWERLKARVAEGRIKAEGGMWLEPDTNLPSGEALIRQVAFAKDFYQREFGLDTRVLWLPDTFGFSAALPQIMRGTGLDYFATKKIIDNYNDSDPFPLVTFRWKGLDGSEVLSHVYRKCNSPLDPRTLAKRWNVDRAQKDGVSTYLFPFGYGDGGGGPTRTHVEFARRLGNLEGNPRTVWSDPLAFFKDLESRGGASASCQGELYFQEHRGTYTSQARVKRLNRKAEIALREAEFWSAAACASSGAAWPAARLKEIWKKLLFNHFHDIISGASIARVYEEAHAQLEEARSSAEALSREALMQLGEKEAAPGAKGGVTVFNSLSWERKVLIKLPEGSGALASAEGEALRTQKEGADTWAELSLPPAGWAGFPTASRPGTDAAGSQAEETGTSLVREGDCYVLENRHLKVRVDSRGRIPSILDKESGLELAAAPCNEFRLYKDVTTNYDAWDIDSMYKSLPVETGSGEARVEAGVSGPLFASLRLRLSLASSSLVQEIRLGASSRRLEFHTRIDWRENHRLLKVDFPTRLRADDALYEIQFGHVRRPTHANRRFDADRYEGCHHRWVALAETGRGVAILNDCKYGSNVAGGTISLTLLKAPFVPDMKADRCVHDFSYAFMAWNGDFAAKGPVREGYDFNTPPLVAEGTLPSLSLFRVDAPSVVLETLKLAEDGSGDLVLRLYESSGSATRARLSMDPGLGLAYQEALRTDLLEKGGSPAAREGRDIALEFRAFEIQTLRLRRG